MKNLFTYPTAFLLGLGLLAAPKAEAQQFSKRKQYNSIGFSLNAMNYFGDLVPNPDFTSFRVGATRPNVGLSITRRFFPRVSGRLSVAYGRITGDDEKADPNGAESRYRYSRNMNFRNDIIEGSAVAIIDLFENRNNYIKRPDFVPYVFAGVAVYHHNPQGEVRSGGAAFGLSEGTYVDLQPLKTEAQTDAYSLTQFSIPFGGGIRYRVNRNFDASLEIGWRKTFTDYLDDVSTVYADPANLATPAAQYFGSGISKNTGLVSPVNSPGERRGIGDRDDWYIVTGVSLNYILTPHIKNPKFR